MRHYDFVFVFEGKNRELENDCLIAQELENRGYKVGFIETWMDLFENQPRLHTKVAVGFAMYNEDVLRYIDSFVIGCNKYINMQCEQIYTNDALNLSSRDGDTFVGITGIASNAAHIAWGRNTKKRLIERFGIDSRNCQITGNVTLDFLRPELRSYYSSRTEIFKKYKIDCEKKVILFISSFSYVNMPESLAESDMMNSCGVDVKEFIEYSIRSQKELMGWFDQMLKEYPDILLIYRPHPAENDNIELEEMEKRTPRFRVINELSVKQWILVCDKIYTWYSTSILEVYSAGKNCHILRPIGMNPDYELELYNDAHFISSYQDFLCTIEADNCQFPIAHDTIMSYSLIDGNTPAYVKVADYFDEVYKNSYFQIDLGWKREIKKYTRNIRFYIVKLLDLIGAKKIYLKYRMDKLKKETKDWEYKTKMYQNNKVNKTEIYQIKEKIKQIVDDYHIL